MLRRGRYLLASGLVLVFAAVASALSVTATIQNITVTPTMVYVTTAVEICITRADVMSNPGVTEATGGIELWDDDDWFRGGDDYIGPASTPAPVYHFDLTACVDAINSDPAVTQCCEEYSIVDCWDKAKVQATEDEPDLYVHVSVHFGSANAEDDSEVHEDVDLS